MAGGDPALDAPGRTDYAESMRIEGSHRGGVRRAAPPGRSIAALLGVLAVILHALAAFPAVFPTQAQADPLATDLAVHCAPAGSGAPTPSQMPQHDGANCPFCLCLHMAPPALQASAAPAPPLPPAIHAAEPVGADGRVLAGRLGKSPYSQRAPPSIV